MESMPVVLLFVITMAANLAGGVARTYYSKSVSQTFEGYHLFNAATSLICGVTLAALSGGRFEMSVFTLGLAVLFGAITAVQQVMTSAALSAGPFSYTSVIISMSTILTALSGLMFFGETVRPTQLVGIALMLGCLALSVKKEEDDQKQKTLRWIGMSLLACLCSGGVGIMQKVHQSSTHRNELTMFLIVAFACSFVFSLVSMAVQKKRSADKQGAAASGVSTWKLIGLFLAGGVGVALNNLINLYLSGVVASAVFFPIVNGGGLVLITVASLVLFREKLSARQWVGLGLGIVATLLLCI